jgi:D-sedoheptulose 7-phosphate isomerase
MQKVLDHLLGVAKLLQVIATDLEYTELISVAAQMINNAFAEGHRLYIAGNGGSDGDTKHFAAELVGHYRGNEKPLPVIALGSNPSFDSSWGNDVDFHSKFARELDAYGLEGDVFFAISTSGNSENLVRGAHVARSKRMRTIALLGKGGGELKRIANHYVLVPSIDTPSIQVAHIAIIHAICECINR